MGLRLQPILLARSVLMQRFTVSNFQSEFSDEIKQMAAWVKEGKIKSTETIEKSFEKLPKALLDLFNGDNTGKMIAEA